MATDISLCSQALLLLGADTIASFDEGSLESTVASNLYEDTVRDILTKTRWRFASKKMELSRLTTEPLNQWKYQFQLPIDMLMLIRTYPTSNYEIYQDKLYTNNADVEIDYIYRVNEQFFPAYFVDALIYRLASKFAIPVTDDAAKGAEMRANYEILIKQARQADSQGRPNVGIEDADLWESYGGPFA